MGYQEDKMNEITVIIVCGSAEMTRFMQDADLFERFKIVAQARELVLALKPDCTKTRALTELRDVLEKNGQRVAAIFIPNESEGAWRDETVKAVSDGARWCLLDDCLASYGFVQPEPVPA